MWRWRRFEQHCRYRLRWHNDVSFGCTRWVVKLKSCSEIRMEHYAEPKNRRMLRKNACIILISVFLPTFDICNEFYAKNPSRIIYFEAKRARFHGNRSVRSQNIDVEIHAWWRRLWVQLSFNRLWSNAEHYITSISTLLDVVFENDNVGPCK